MVTGALSSNKLLSMHRSHPRESLSLLEATFKKLPLPGKGLVIYEAIAKNDDIQFLQYLSWGWQYTKPLKIEPHPLWTALAWSIYFNRFSLVEILMRVGAHGSDEVERGVTALKLAQHLGKREIIKLFEQDQVLSAPSIMVTPQGYTSDCDTVVCLCGICCCCSVMLATGLADI